MAAEEDHSDWLPQPPPPRPARRDEAINAAMRKFDGEEQHAAAHERPKRSWASTHRPQVAALASAALLVFVGVPAAYVGLQNAPPEREFPPVPAQAPRAEAPTAPAAQTPAERSAVTVPSAPQPSAPAAAKSGIASQGLADASGAVSQSVRAQEVQEAPAAAPPPPPPPPPPPAPVSEAATSNDIILTGSRIPNRALAKPRGFEAKSAERVANRSDAAPAKVDPRYSAFLSRLQAATRRNDRRAMVGLVGFPLRVNEGGGSRTYRDAKSVERDFDRIFTAEVRRAIAAQHADRLFVRDLGAMIGNGEVWFDQTCIDAACSKPGQVRITAVNP